MLRSARWAAIILVISTGCAATTDDAAPDQGVAEDDVRTTRTLDIKMTWSCGENDEPSLQTNDDGEYEHKEEVTLGPLADCAGPAANRPAGAKCSWSAPSTCWDVTVSIAAGANGVPVLSVSGYAGDMDSTFGGKLPVSNVPRSQEAWETETSPDNAGGAWGSAKIAVRRVR